MIRLDGPPSERTRIRRKPERGRYDHPTIDAILDEAPLCTVATIVGDTPVVIPTMFVRVDDHVYIHGSQASRVLRALASGAPACFAVTLLDALVLSRSAMHHSMNYRSVVAYGRFREVRDRGRKLALSDALVDHVVAGRAREVRAPNRKELAATMILGMPLDEASAKIRTGPPVDDEADLDGPAWAGEVPLRLIHAEPISSTPGRAAPPSVQRLLRHASSV